MSDEYFVECACGKKIRVELFEAGTSKRCPSCDSTVSVPNSTKLKELSGDRYPLLSPLEKIRRTSENTEPPFDGLCHGCSNADADYQVPIRFDIMVERHVAEDGGIRPTITGGVKLVAAAAEEMWEATTFPLLLCEQCHAEFQSSRSRAKLMNTAKLFSLLALLGAFLYFAYYNAELVAALAGVIWLIGMIAWAARFRQSKRLDPLILGWLNKIRWFPEAIAAEDEFKLSFATSQPFHREAAVNRSRR